MARPKSEETKKKEAELAALPQVDVVEAISKFLDKSIFATASEDGVHTPEEIAYIKGAQVAINNFKDQILEMRTKFDEVLSANRANDANYLPGVDRFRKERDDSPKAVKPNALQMLGLG